MDSKLVDYEGNLAFKTINNLRRNEKKFVFCIMAIVGEVQIIRSLSLITLQTKPINLFKLQLSVLQTKPNEIRFSFNYLLELILLFNNVISDNH